MKQYPTADLRHAASHEMRSTAAGLYSKRFGCTTFPQMPCLFLDRDGVVVDETNYLHCVSDVQFIPGVREAVARVNSLSVPVVMVTNQAGIGRGLYRWSDFHSVQDHIYEHYEAAGAHFDMVLACAYHQEGVGSYAVADHAWRKPQPGMLKEAERVLRIDLGKSYIVGDTLGDLSAGQAAGLSAGALVNTGHGLREWLEKGEQAFAGWEKTGAFRPRHFDNAADAILDWLDRQRLLSHA